MTNKEKLEVRLTDNLIKRMAEVVVKKIYTEEYAATTVVKEMKRYSTMPEWELRQTLSNRWGEKI